MVLTSVQFLFFIIVSVAVYYLMPKKHRWIILLLAGVFFYFYSCGKYIIYILATGLTTWLGARLIEKYNKKPKAQYAVTAITILLNIGVLATVKYYNFFADNIELLIYHAGGTTEIPNFDIIAPLGISFYTFTSVGYILDIKRGVYAAEKNPLKYFTCLIYFPHIIQGPISRINRLGSQIIEGRDFNYSGVKKGLQLCAWGYLKKIAIADVLAQIVDPIFANYADYNGFQCIIAVVGYAIQIYADFSGCMDILGGISEVFGISLEKNFDTPYLSKSVPEFWRRWHITLGAWFRDYLFYSVIRSAWAEKLVKLLSKVINRKKLRNLPTYFGLAIVWATTGLWHGASWHYIFWGVYYGILIILSTMFKRVVKNINEKLKINTECKSFEWFRIARTFIIICFGYILFRAENLSSARGMIENIFTTNYLSCVLEDGFLDFAGFGLSAFQVPMLIIGLVLLIVTDIYKNRSGNSIRDVLEKQNALFRWMLYWGIVIFVCAAFVMQNGGFGGTVEFIYMQF